MNSVKCSIICLRVSTNIMFSVVIKNYVVHFFDGMKCYKSLFIKAGHFRVFRGQLLGHDQLKSETFGRVGLVSCR